MTPQARNERIALFSALGVLAGLSLTGNTGVGVGVAILISVTWFVKYKNAGYSDFFK